MRVYRRVSKPLLLGAAAAALGFAVARSFSKTPHDDDIAYIPRDLPKALAPDVWIVDSGPITAMGLKLPVRMTVLKLQDGGLLLHSPTPYTPDLAQRLEAIGPVRHLVAPNIAHWMFLADWQNAFPEATTWSVPALRHRTQVRHSGIRLDEILADEAPAAWSAEIEQGLVEGGGGFEEVWLFHKASRTLLLTDLIENVRPEKLPPLTALLMRATAATRATTAVHVRAAVALGGSDARNAIRAMIATRPERVVFAHGDILTQDATKRLIEAFAWLS